VGLERGLVLRTSSTIQCQHEGLAVDMEGLFCEYWDANGSCGDLVSLRMPELTKLHVSMD